MLRSHTYAAAVVLTAIAGFIAALSSGPGYLRVALNSHSAELEAISERAERLQMFSQHVRKASLTSPAQGDLPFGGFVGRASAVEPGARIKIGRPGLQSTFEVTSAHRITPAADLAVSPVNRIDLMLVSGRMVNSRDGALMRFLVAVAPEKPVERGTTDYRSL